MRQPVSSGSKEPLRPAILPLKSSQTITEPRNRRLRGFISNSRRSGVAFFHFASLRSKKLTEPRNRRLRGSASVLSPCTALPCTSLKVPFTYIHAFIFFILHLFEKNGKKVSSTTRAIDMYNKSETSQSRLACIYNAMEVPI